MSNKPRPKLRRLKDGYVMRNHRIVRVEDLSEHDRFQLEQQDLTTMSADQQLDEDAIVTELLRIDGKYAEMEMELEKGRSIRPDKIAAIELTLRVLLNRRSLLQKLLAKKLPDRRSVTVDANYTFGVSSAEGLSDEVLLAAMAGKLSDDQMEALKLLMQPAVGGEQ